MYMAPKVFAKPKNYPSQEQEQQSVAATPVSMVQPITSPLPNTPAAAATPSFATQLSTSSIDEALIMPDEEVPEPENPQGRN